MMTMTEAFTAILGYVGQFVSSFISNATVIANWVMSTPLAMVGIVAWVIILFVGILAKFIKQ